MEEKKLKRVNIRLFEEDWKWLKKNHGDNYNAQIRRVVKNWVWLKRRQKGKVK